MTIANLGLAVDSSSVVTATPSLDKMAAAAGRAEAAVTRLGGASRTSSTGLGAMNRAAQQAEAGVNRVTGSVTGARYQTAGLAAQFQDIGVTAVAGMNPLIIGLQQGTQLAGQMATMANPIKGVGQALASLLSPVSLLSVGFSVLLAVGIQWAASMFQASNDAKRALADQAMSTDQVKSAIGQLQSVTDDYARSIRGTAKDQEIATASILANSEKEFNAKKSLLELELKRQQALAATQRLDLMNTQSQLRSDISSAILMIDDPRESPFAPSPTRINRREALGEFLAGSALPDKIKELRANLELTEVATSSLEDALKTTFSDSVAISAGNIASTTHSAAEKMQDKYDNLVRSANQHIAASQLEASTLGMTTEQINAQTYAMELLNRAANNNISLSPAMRSELVALSEAMAAAEERTRFLTQAANDNKAVWGAAQDGVSSVIKTWMRGGDVLDTISDKLLNIADMLVDMAVRNLFMAAFGGGGMAMGTGGGLLGGALIPGILHSGGVAGRDGYTHGKAYPAAAWTAAPRFHNGTMFADDEFPAILQRGEKVIPRNQNGGGSIYVEATMKVVNGNLVPVITSVSGQVAGQQIKQAAPAIVGASVQQANRTTPGALAQYQQQRGGSDYRVA